jgi:hypothetical protein
MDGDDRLQSGRLVVDEQNPFMVIEVGIIG